MNTRKLPLAVAKSKRLDDMPEFDATYRNCPGHPGYKVGSDGSVWSQWEQRSLGIGRGTRSVRGDRWKRLTSHMKKRGYPIVSLYPGHLTLAVHRLVLEAFVGPCPPGMEARHFPDRNPANNALTNLSWSTHADNEADKIQHGTQLVGVRHPNAVLNDDKVREIRRLHSQGARFVDIAKQFGISSSTARDVASRKRWKHVS